MLKITIGKELAAAQPRRVIEETIKQGASVYDALEFLKLKPRDEVRVLQSFFEAPFVSEKFRKLVLRVAIGGCSNIPQALESDMWEIASLLFKNEIYNAYILEVCRDGVFSLLEGKTVFHIACDKVIIDPENNLRQHEQTDGVYFCDYDYETKKIERIAETPLHRGDGEETNEQEED